MKLILCSIPTKQDKLISDRCRKLGLPLSQSMVALFRDSYDHQYSDLNDSQHPAYDTLSEEDALKAIIEIYNQNKKDLKEETKKVINKNGTLNYSTYKLNAEKIKKVWNAKTRSYRVNYLNAELQFILTRIKRSYPTKTLTEILKGFYVMDANGKKTFVGGQFHLFEQVYERILNTYASISEDREKDNTSETERNLLIHVAEELEKILENWPLLVYETKRRIKEFENFLLGSDIDYVATEEDLEYDKEFDLEEAPKDHFGTKNDEKDPYAFTDDILNLLTHLYKKKKTKNEYGETIEDDVKDDIQNNVYEDGRKVFNKLVGIIRGADSAEEMMQKLEHNLDRFLWMPQLVALLKRYPQNQTALYVQGKKAFQLYYCIFFDKKYGKECGVKGGVLNYMSSVMTYVNKFIYEFQHGLRSSVVDYNGMVNVEEANKLRTNLNMFRRSSGETHKIGGIFNKLKCYTKPKVIEESERGGKSLVERVMSVLGKDGLGIVSSSEEDQLILQDALQLIFDTDRKQFNKIIYAIGDFAEHFLADSNEKHFKKNILLGEPTLSNGKKKIRRLRYEALVKIIKILYPYIGQDYINKSALFISKKKDHKKISLFSDIFPSFLSDLIEKVTNENHSEVKKYLENTFFKSRFFKTETSNGELIIYNRWLKDLYEGGNKSMKDIFKFARMVGAKGDVNETFENFSSIQHLSSIMAMYFQEQQYQYERGIIYLEDIRQLNELMLKVKELELPYDQVTSMETMETKNLNRIIKKPHNSVQEVIKIIQNQRRERKHEIKRNGEDKLGIHSSTIYVVKNSQKAYKINSQGELEEMERPSAWYPTFILGDSGKQMMLQAPRYSKSEIIEGLYNVWLQECVRCREVRAVNAKTKIKNYSDNEEKFTYFEELRSKLLSKGLEINSNGHTERKVLTMGDLDRAEYKQAIMDLIEKSMDQQFETFFEYCDRQLHILDLSDRVDSTTGETYYKWLPKTIHPLTKNIIKSDLDRIAKRQFEDFFWNYKFAMIQQFQITTVDPSFYKNVEEFQKRNKQEQTSGSPLCLDAVNPWEENHPFSEEDKLDKGIYFEDIERDTAECNSSMMHVLEKLFGEKEGKKYVELYHKSSLTDGQTIRTLDSYRKIMIMANKWSDEYEMVYQHILQIRLLQNHLRETVGKEKRNQIQESINHLKLKVFNSGVIFQPIKSFIYGYEKFKIEENDTLPVPSQHKHSEMVIIPELMEEGEPMKALGEFLLENGLDYASSTAAIKVGDFGAVDISKCKSKEDLYSVLKNAYIHKISLSYYRIQQNVPPHNDYARLVGNQLRKLALEKIQKTKSYNHYFREGFKLKLRKSKQGENTTFSGTQIKGEQVVQLYNSCIIANYLESFNEFAKKIANIENASEILFHAMQSSGDTSLEKLMNVCIDPETKDFNIPLCESTMEYDTMAALLGLFRQFVNRQTMQGGSFVQATAYGLRSYSESDNLKYVTDDTETNILYAECAVPWALSYTTADGKQVPLPFEKYCNLDGTLKLSDKISDNPMYKSWGGKIPLIEIDYPDILSIIAYRIPTENLYSTMMLRIVRFEPVSGVIKVPVQGTTQAGFDFDIDKLYFLRKKFKVKTGYKLPVRDIWGKWDEDKHKFISGIYAEFPEIYNALKSVRLEKNSVKENTFGNLFASEFAKLIENDGKENTETAKKLYQYWNEAGLLEKTGKTYKQFFNDYVASHPELWYDFEQWENDKLPSEQTRTARDNMFFNILSKRLQDPETLRQRITPGGFIEASEGARYIRELLYNNTGIVSGDKIDEDRITEAMKSKELDPKPAYDPTNPITLLVYNQQNQIADKLIGVFANQNSNHVFSSLLETFELRTPIAFGDNPEGLKDLLNKENAEEKENIIIRVAELLAASVDAVKDPVLNFLGLNAYTASAGGLLVRLGYSMKEVGLLFNQPIIKEACELAATKGVTINAAVFEVLEKYGKNTTFDKIGVNQNEVSSQKLKLNIYYSSPGRIRNKQIVQEEWIAQNVQNQLQVLKVFKDILDSASAVTSFIATSKYTASNSVGSTMGDIFSQELKVISSLGENGIKKHLVIKASDYTEDTLNPNINIEYNERGEINVQEFIEKVLDNPFAFEQVNYSIIQQLRKVFARFYPYDIPLYQNVRELANNALLDVYLDGTQINSLHRDFPQYLLQLGLSKEPNLNVLKANAENKYGLTNHKGHVFTNKEYYTQIFPELLYTFLSSEKGKVFKEKYAIFKNLDFVYNDKYIWNNQKADEIHIKPKSEGVNEFAPTGISAYGLYGQTADSRDYMIESWAEMQENAGKLTVIINRNEERLPEELQNLAQDIWLSLFHSMGLAYNAKTLLPLTPTIIKKDLPGYLAMYRSLVANKMFFTVFGGDNGLLVQDFFKQWLMNHAEKNYQFVATGINKDSLSLSNAKFTRNTDTFVENFTVSYMNLSESDKKKVAKYDKQTHIYTFSPLIKMGDFYYMAVGEEKNFPFFMSTSGSMRYEIVPLLGSEGESTAYYASYEEACQYIPLPYEETEVVPPKSSVATNSVEDDDPFYTPHDYSQESDKEIVPTVTPVEDEKPQGTVYTKEEALAYLESLQLEEATSASNVSLDAVMRKVTVQKMINQTLTEKEIVTKINALKKQFHKEPCWTIDAESGSIMSMC